MGTTATYQVNNPVAGQEYIAPAAYWFVPSNATSVSVTIQTFDASGNLVTVSSMTAIVRDTSTNADRGSFTGSGGVNRVTTTNTVGNGSDAYAPAGKINSGAPAQLRMYATYTGSAYDQPPLAPQNMSPAAGSTVTTQTPALTGTFSDPTSGDTAQFYRVQVANAANGGGSIVYDSGNVTAVATGASTVTCGASLTYGTTCSWRAQFSNQRGNFGPWSGWVTFSVVQGPSAPGSVTPAGQQTSLTPAWSFLYSSPGAVALAFYHYTITAQAGGATVYDSGAVAHSAASGTTVSGTIPSGAALAYGGQYIFSVFATDTNGATSPTTTSAFAVAALPQTAPSSPINNANVNSQTPTLAFSYSDPSYTQASYQLQVLNKTTQAVLWDSGQVASAATSVVFGGTAIAWNTPIQWRVQVWDTAGLASGWSPYAYALVINSPVATITSPANGGTVPNNQPTVTWTYTASSTGNPQASATLTLLDSNGATLATLTQAGAGTSAVLPAGVLFNLRTYSVQVSVTDTGALTGTSGANSFTVSYNPPADLQGQPLATAHNYLLAPYLNTDGNQDGVSDSWSATAGGTGPAGAFAIDPSVAQGVPLASGDGAATGAQRIGLTAAGASSAYEGVLQDVLLATVGWTAGTTIVSAVTQALFTLGTGGAYAQLALQFYNGGSFLSQQSSATQGDTAGAAVRLLGPQGVTIPASTTKVRVLLLVHAAAAGDTGTAWFYGAQLEAAASSDPAFIAGDLGTGYSYDANGYAVRTLLAGNLPTLTANPGADTDPISATGGSLSLGWDPTLADSRFTAYLLDRRRQDQSTDDTAWTTVATLTNKSQASWTDFAAGGNTTYQYGIRQQILYSDGSVGASAHRALVTGSVSYSPAWYLVNTSGSLQNLRLTRVSAKRALAWKERATYSAFLGRVGAAKDAGPPAGYTFDLTCYFDDAWGDNRAAVRRQVVSMQRLTGTTWLLKDPAGLVVPVHLQDLELPEEDAGGDTLLTVTLHLLQAADTLDY